MKFKMLKLGIMFFLQGGFIFSVQAQNSTQTKKHITDSAKQQYSPPPQMVIPKGPQSDQVYETYKEAPETPGGQTGYYNYLAQNIQYPDRAMKAGVQGIVYISLIVNEDGSLSDLKVRQDRVGYGCGEEALRVIKAMPNWKPGKINGKPVKCRYIVPVKFVLK